MNPCDAKEVWVFSNAMYLDYDVMLDQCCFTVSIRASLDSHSLPTVDFRDVPKRHLLLWGGEYILPSHEFNS